MTTFTLTKTTAPRLLTYAEVAKRFGMKLNTLYSLVRERRIPHVRLGKRLVRFPLTDLVKWIGESRVEVGNRSERSR